jgi:hypothetical protein
MLCEGVPLIAGNRNDKKAKKSDGFWCEIAACIASNYRFLKEKAGISPSKTKVTTSSSEMISQIHEVTEQFMAMTSPLLALLKQ